jgi:hypothetical protein
VIIPNSAREIAGTIIKGKYHSMNSEFNNSSYEVNDTVGSFEATTEIPSWTMGDEEADLETSTTAEEYFSNSSGISVVEEVLNDVVDRVIEICEANEANKNVSFILFLWYYYEVFARAIAFFLVKTSWKYCKKKL